MTSKDIAKRYGKKHCNIVLYIRLLKEGIGYLNKGVAEETFQETEYKTSSGRYRPMFKVSKDGFYLLSKFLGNENLTQVIKGEYNGEKELWI